MSLLGISGNTKAVSCPRHLHTHSPFTVQSQLAVAQQQEAEALLEQTQSFLLEAIKSLRSYAVHLENKLSDEKGNLAVDEATCSIMKRADQDLARALIVPQLVEEHFRGRGSGASSDSMDGGLVSRLAKAEQVSLKACQVSAASPSASSQPPQRVP